MRNKRNLALGVVAVLTVVLIALIAVVVLTGSGSSQGLSKARAGELSRAALLAPTDLMGTGWRTKGMNEFDEDTSGFGASPACQEQKAAFEEVLKSKPLLADRSEKSLMLPVTPALVIDEWIEVYNSPSNVKDLLPKIERLMGDSMVTCTSEGYGTTGIKATRTTPRQPPPSGGKVIAMEIKSPNSPVTLRSEYYYWRFGNVGISLTFNGQQERVTTDLVKSTIEKVQENLEKAAAK